MMWSIIVLFLVLVPLGGPAQADCNPQQYVCDNPSLSEIHRRATDDPLVVIPRRLLGTDWARVHERVLNARSWVEWSCVKRMLPLPEGNINAALCMPAWMRRVPPEAILTFVYQGDITQGARLRRAMYIISPTSQAAYWRHQFR